MSGHPAGIIKSGHPPSPLFALQVASIQTLTKYKDTPHFDLIIIDEAHHACSRSYTRVMEQYPNAKILGFTATPCRNDGQGFKYLFEKLICGPTTREPIERGHLCPYTLFEAGKTVDTSKVKKNGEGDFNTKRLSEAVATQIEPDDVVREWLDKAKDKQTVVFAVDVERSKEYAVTSMPLLRMVRERRENIRRALHSVGSFAATVELKAKTRIEETITENGYEKSFAVEECSEEAIGEALQKGRKIEVQEKRFLLSGLTFPRLF